MDPPPRSAYDFSPWQTARVRPGSAAPPSPPHWSHCWRAVACSSASSSWTACSSLGRGRPPAAPPPPGGGRGGVAGGAAGDLSRSWGRPVEIGGVVTKLVPWLGVRVTDVRIGAAAEEGDRSLLELRRAEVRLNLFGALLSRGKDVEVRLAEVEGLRVNG